MIYVVTLSDLYYPESGAEDWELVTRDLGEAKARALGLAGGFDLHYHMIHLIGINEDNLHVQELEGPWQG